MIEREKKSRRLKESGEGRDKKRNKYRNETKTKKKVEMKV